MFYDRFKQLCQEKGISCNKAALEMGLSNATPTKWKKTGAIPSGETLDRIAAYFGVSVDHLLGKDAEKAPTASGERSVTDEDIKFALFGGSGAITDAMYDEVKRFAAFLLQRETDQKE